MLRGQVSNRVAPDKVEGDFSLSACHFTSQVVHMACAKSLMGPSISRVLYLFSKHF